MDEPQVDDNGTSQHLWITCPRCHRSNLRIKRANLGRRVACKHCGEQFRAESGRDPRASDPESRLVPQEPPASPDAGASQEDELRRIRVALAAQTSERDAAQRQLDEARDRLRDLQEKLGQAHGRLRQAESAREELDSLRADNERLSAEAEGLRGRTAGAAELEGRLRAEIQAARTQLEQIDFRAVETTARELAEVRTERDRLRIELRDREAQRLRLAELTDEVEAIRAERDRLNAEDRAVAAREEQLQAQAAEVERRAARERDESEDQ